ncbi:hypothetical protein BGZ57DRAFT_760642 [Hyaloscypha finlandica]|nr:hypothetical protein BGZ57DRAFT_760642 [Hyaloscypha finlandica]
MSFLRKRSRSQCSFSKGDEEITVTRIQQNNFNRQSRADTFVSARSSLEVGASDFAVHDSCVIRNFPKHKSSHLRFLAWVAFTRKYTDEWITEDERRTCPLLWCRTIFSRLGAKPHHTEFVAPEPEPQKPLSKIAEDSATSYPYDPSSFEGMSHSYDEDQALDWNHQYPQELPNTSVCRELPGDWTAASHELPDTPILEMQGTECPIELGVGSEDWADNFYASSLEEWDIPSTAIKRTSASPKLARIDTSFTHLNMVQIFSLTHVAYAFAITVDCNQANVEDQQWFNDSLSWAEALTSERPRQMYLEIARAIWQPLDIFAEDMPHEASQSSDKENMLLTACKHFLDVFESFSVPESVPSLPHGIFDFGQELFQSRCKTRVIDELIKTQSLEAFDRNVVTIRSRLQEGKITSTRQLELELICVGKHVTHLCDSLYREEAGTLKSRAQYHVQDISLVKQYLPEEDFIDEHEEDDCDHGDQHNHEHDDMEDLLDFDARSEDIEACINAFKNDADQTLSHIDINYTIKTASATRWKASNLRRHKRTQHPTELKVHRCGYPGCKSVFTRSDNLRSHRRDKGHFVGFEGGPFTGDDMGGMGDMEGMRGPKRRRGGD